MILDPETLPKPFLSRMEQILGREYPAYLASLKEAPFKVARINTLKHENTPLPGFDMIPSGFAENSWLIRTEGRLGGTPEYLAANKNGSAIIIGHVDKSVKILPALLREMYPELKQAGYVLTTPARM